jgi:hypothetical protein
MMQTIPEIKMLLLEILESAFQNGDVHATQQLGVNMPKAAKRGGDGDHLESECGSVLPHHAADGEVTQTL